MSGKTWKGLFTVVKLVHASLNAKGGLENSFHHWAGVVKLFYDSLSTRNDPESTVGVLCVIDYFLNIISVCHFLFC